MLPPQLRIAFGHLDVRVTKYLGQLVQITAVHHVPGCKGVPQIMEPEISAGVTIRPMHFILKECVELSKHISVGGKVECGLCR
jgi:hypothetical protein